MQRIYFDILFIFYSAWKTYFMDWQFSSRKTLKISETQKIYYCVSFEIPFSLIK